MREKEKEGNEQRTERSMWYRDEKKEGWRERELEKEGVGKKSMEKGQLRAEEKKMRGQKRHTEGNRMEGKKNLRKGSETWKKCSGISFPVRETEATAVSNEEMESGWIERTISSKCS